jgi:putative SOS response-associated peptidase YedK
VGPPNELVKAIHKRMPVIVAPEFYESWLNGSAGKEILIPYPAAAMKAEPISTRVNNPKNDDEAVLTSLRQG